MSLKAEYTLGDDIYPEAILRIQQIKSTNTENEFFENVKLEDSKIAQVVSWVNRFENSALVYVWGDELARKNRARVIHWFSIDFDYNPNKNEHIYNQAYNQLKLKYPNSTRY